MQILPCLLLLGILGYCEISSDICVKTPPIPNFRRHYTMGYNDKNWLQIEQDNFLSLFLLKDVGNAPIPNSKAKHIEGDLLTFLRQNIIDYITIR